MREIWKLAGRRLDAKADKWGALNERGHKQLTCNRKIATLVSRDVTAILMHSTPD